MKKRVLVIDDQKLICDLVERWLTKAGYQTVRAYDGMTGLQIIKDDHPDLIMIDILLPGLSGIELCETIKNQADTNDIPIILMSALYKDGTLLEQKKNIADDFIEKPFKEDTVLERVNRFLLPPIDRLEIKKNSPGTNNPEPRGNDQENDVQEDYWELPLEDEVENETPSEGHTEVLLDPVTIDERRSTANTPGSDHRQDEENKSPAQKENNLSEEDYDSLPPPYNRKKNADIIEINLSPIRPDKPNSEEKQTDTAHDPKKDKMDRMIEEELANLFRIVKDKK